VSVALYKPFGIPGIVVGTAASSAAMTFAQIYYLRRELHGRLEGRQTAIVVAQMTFAAALLGVVTYGVWRVLDEALGRGLFGQILSVGTALTLGALVYALTVHLLRIPEARQIERLLAGRLLHRDKR
jgi:putative peptidoglycan lipid II flippase